MATFQTFDPKHLIVTVKGVAIEGFSETQVSIARDSEMFVMQTGATGDVIRTKTNNTSAGVTLTLQQSSLSNAVLNALASQDEKQSTGVFDILIEYKPDVGEKAQLFQSNTAYIEKKPDGTWANSAQDREWLIKCAQSEYDLGVTSTDQHGFVGAL